jgi:hypothetical protein
MASWPSRLLEEEEARLCARLEQQRNDISGKYYARMLAAEKAIAAKCDAEILKCYAEYEAAKAAARRNAREDTAMLSAYRLAVELYAQNDDETPIPAEYAPFLPRACLARERNELLRLDALALRAGVAAATDRMVENLKASLLQRSGVGFLRARRSEEADFLEGVANALAYMDALKEGQ